MMKLETVDGELVHAEFTTSQQAHIELDAVAGTHSVVMTVRPENESYFEKAIRLRLERAEVRSLVHALSCALVAYGIAPETPREKGTP